MSDEKEEAYIRLYNELKINYKFIQTIITTDFEMSNIKAIKNIFNNENVKIITCFFHLVQAWWRKANQIGSRRKDIKGKIKFLIINLKLYVFMKFEEVIKYYNKIKSHKDLQDESFEIFF